ncbi:hypothetical protein TI39_contig480g00002 [Zymoseptoria brevis]|uniref:Uncharacterized protein n=1 Tax=Zymoseptoria brevis TaxID=1047168 RepID=A0A0F4GKH9_9PEZI|nr:hypothetical protein TI39_contig480g00002 [Zymoseptoria brevis]
MHDLRHAQLPSAHAVHDDLPGFFSLHKHVMCFVQAVAMCSYLYIDPLADRIGPLSFIGDPLGHILYFALSPFGYVLKAIGNPNGEALLKVQDQAAKELKYIEDVEGKRKSEVGRSTGVKPQTAGNPLGL